MKRTQWNRLQLLDREITALDYNLRFGIYCWDYYEARKKTRAKLDHRRKELRAKMKENKNV